MSQGIMLATHMTQMVITHTHKDIVSALMELVALAGEACKVAQLLSMECGKM